MSGLRNSQIQRELNQASSFLTGLGIDYLAIEPGPNPPDVIVTRNGLPSLAIEVTEYHPRPEGDRVGGQFRWGQLRDLLDRLKRQHANLKGVSINPIFLNDRVPRVCHHQAIAEEMVRLVEYAVERGWADQKSKKLSFSNHIKTYEYREICHKWLELSAKRWPVMAQHVNVIFLNYFPWDGYFPSNNYQTQTAWCSPYPEAFFEVFEGKEARIRKAIAQGKYSKGTASLWLLIVSNSLDDISSFIFGDAHLKRSVEESGFDFEGSLFDRIWLMNWSGGGESQSIYPWVERHSQDWKAVCQEHGQRQ